MVFPLNEIERNCCSREKCDLLGAEETCEKHERSDYAYERYLNGTEIKIMELFRSLGAR